MTIPRSVTSIGAQAFYYCLKLKAVYFLGNAPSFGSSAFASDNATIYCLPGTTAWNPFYTGLLTVLWNAQVQTTDGSFGVQNNQFGFNGTGTTNIPFVVEACTDLANPVLLPVATNTLTDGPFYFSDPQWTNYPTRLYRLRWP